MVRDPSKRYQVTALNRGQRLQGKTSAKYLKPPPLRKVIKAMPDKKSPPYPVTPDGRYFVVRGRLWRTTNPSLDEEARQSLTVELMRARRAVSSALRAGDSQQLAAARVSVDKAKTALGERGPVWWDDGTPDFNRHLAKNTPYAEWYGLISGTSA